MLKQRTQIWMAVIGALFLLLLPYGEGRAQDAYPEPVDPYVNDFANLISLADESAIADLLADVRREHGVEVTVVTIRSVSDYGTRTRTIESFATTLFNRWGVGDSGRDDGVMLLVAVDDREVRIEVGSGYGSTLNTPMQRIIDRILLPAFREDDYSGGILAGTNAIVGELREVESAAASPDEGFVEAGTNWFRQAAAWMKATVAVLFAATIGAFTFGARNLLRRRPRSCQECGAKMVRLDEVADDAYLDDGQLTEEKLKSVDYDVWHCPDCGAHHVHAFRTLFSRQPKCPSCGYRTIRQTTTVVTAATEHSTGEERVDQECVHCGYQNTEYRTIRQKSSDDNDYFSGGTSSGGGASGKW